MKSILIGMLTAVLAAGAQNNEAERQLKAAINFELVNGDLKVAIKQYGEIVAKYKKDRTVAAMALVHMAECYQKLGDSASRRIYEQVVREYADQRDAVVVAKAKLGKVPAQTDSHVSFRQVWKQPEMAEVVGTISRDGRYLPYVDWNEHGDLFLHDFSSDTNRRLTDTATDNLPGLKVEQFALFASLSRDSRQLAYWWFRGDNSRSELRLLDLKGDGIAQSRLLFDNQDVASIEPVDWSPDGKSIAVEIQRDDKTRQIGVVSVPDGALRVLKTVDWRGATTLAFSPDGKYLAYDHPASDKTEQRDIFVIATDGSREIAAVVSPSQDSVLGWSNDGRRLLFASDRSGSMGLWSVPFVKGNVDGPAELLRPDIGQIMGLGLTDAGRLYASVNGPGASVPGPADIYTAAFDFAKGELVSPPSLTAQTYVGSNHFPAWSPGGKYLAYGSWRGTGTSRHWVIAIRSTETGDAKEILPSPGFGILKSLLWAPDGLSLIAGGRDNKGRYGIFRVDAQTGQASILVTQGDRETLGLVGISPDGKKLYYATRYNETRYERNSQTTVCIEKDLAAGSERELLRTQTRFGPLSPDGRYLIVGVPSKPSLSIIPTAGGDLKELKIETGIRSLSWAPDSSAVYAITLPGELWSLPIDGSKPRKLELMRESNTLNMTLFRAHPDGRRIALEAQPTGRPAEVWVLENFLPTLTAKK